MLLTWAEFFQAVAAGGAGMLGVYSAEAGLRALRRSGMCPDRWAQDRTALVQRGEAVADRVG
ncbi:hypothetical protein AB0J80_17945 [Actinoplanes sp. NPDC049548]|uniref:hypothetical protein n=1 Tax=Actinoplanes sp. NPDC049548 TaxID=3155152 RepID=UPI003421B72D